MRRNQSGDDATNQKADQGARPVAQYGRENLLHFVFIRMRARLRSMPAIIARPPFGSLRKAHESV
ncbi:protein of unknown function (plasmid) [Caballeronia sp. S22]